MKISKIFLIVVLTIISILALTISANAYTSTELADYITGIHVINGNQYKLTDANAANVKDYLANHPVTDAQAAQIKSLLDQAKSKSEGYSDLSQMSDSLIAEIISLLKQAGNVAGLTVTVDTTNNTITVSNGSTALLSGSYVNGGNGGLTVKVVGSSSAGTASASTPANGGAKTFVYTGANYSIFIGLALIAVVAVSTIFVRKVYAK